jgi:UDP-N-acetylglucosamine diphosphorylase/glucosamine-1-phosphate N-acetyltransferase
MNYILFDGPYRDNLLPFTYTKPVADLRIGILTIREKWELFLKTTTTTVTEDYLSEKYPMVELEYNVMINASVIPSKDLVQQIKSLKHNQAVFYNEELIAFFSLPDDETIDFELFDKINLNVEPILIKNTWDIFSKNSIALQRDYEKITEGRKSLSIPDSVNVVNPEQIFIEEGAILNFVTINASKGPVYIGKNSELMEGSIIRGPLALCEGAVLKLGTKIYGPTTVGPYSKVGGEINNSVILGYSNKGHEGFLGNSVIGEWCNLGADTNTSNLKNNYAEVRLWDYESGRFASTGLQFCGLMMGDHSKCAINTMFNTGTVVGVCANIFGSGFPRNFVPSFSWGGSQGFTTYLTSKAFEVAKIVMSRRNIEFTEQDEYILTTIFNQTEAFRKS